MRIRILKVILPLLLMLSLLVPSSAYAAPDIPEFGGAAAIELSGFVPAFSPDDFTGEDYIRYSELDALGRPGPATACFSSASRPAELRAESDAYLPVGWENVRYTVDSDGKSETRYLYSICHLISPKLGGASSDPRNLFTGTRSLRIDGMELFEKIIADTLSRTAYHILYRVTPLYSGNDLVPFGVQLEAYSVEDAGRTISFEDGKRMIPFNVVLYNVQDGISIDYISGTGTTDPSVKIIETAQAFLDAHRFQPPPANEAPKDGSFEALGNHILEEAAKANAAAQRASSEMVWITETGERYHRFNNCSGTNSNTAIQVPLQEALNRHLTPCSKCW